MLKTAISFLLMANTIFYAVITTNTISFSDAETQWLLPVISIWVFLPLFILIVLINSKSDRGKDIAGHASMAIGVCVLGLILYAAFLETHMDEILVFTLVPACQLVLEAISAPLIKSVEEFAKEGEPFRC